MIVPDAAPMTVDDSRLMIADRIAIPLSELEFDYVRSSGPGGQNVNKVSSQAQMSWNLGESAALPEDVLERFRDRQRNRISKENIFRLNSQRFRDREKNRLDCLRRLEEMIVEVLEPPQARRLTKIPRRVREHRLRQKRLRAQLKQYRRPPGAED